MRSVTKKDHSFEVKTFKTHTFVFLLLIVRATAYSEECDLWIGHTNSDDSGTKYFSRENDCVSTKLNMGTKDRFRLDNLFTQMGLFLLGF